MASALVHVEALKRPSEGRNGSPVSTPTRYIPADRLRTVLSYDDGVLRWRVPNSNAVRAGAPAGTVRPDGYTTVCVDGVYLLAHRVVWAMFTGVWPLGFVDHINRDKADNRIENLREVDKSQNAQNSKFRTDNTSGRRGVTFHKASGKWMAQIKVHHKNKYLGVYSRKEDAISAREAAEATYFTHLGETE